jgi:hypothetical protein
MVQMTTASTNSNRRLGEAFNERFCGKRHKKLINRLSLLASAPVRTNLQIPGAGLADGSEPNSHAKKG